MLQSNSERRNFIDRLIFNIEKKHLKAFTTYNKFTKERLHILKSNAPDSAWLKQIEKKIAVCAYEIIEYRQAAVSKINTNLSLISLPFNSCVIELNYEDTLKITSDTADSNAVIVKRSAENCQSSRAASAQVGHDWMQILELCLQSETQSFSNVAHIIFKTNNK